MSGVPRGPWELLRRATRQARRQGAAAVALAAATLVPLALLVAWAIGDGWAGWSVGPLALVLCATVAITMTLLLLARRWVRPITEAAIAAAAERRHGLSEGSIRGVLELGRGLPPGSSAALYRRTQRELAHRLAGSSPSDLAGDLGQRSVSRVRALFGVAAGLALLATFAGFATPERARSGWTPLLRPVVHMRGPVLAPLTVTPGDAEVPRGSTLDVEVGAPQRSAVTLEWRRAGDVPGVLGMVVIDGLARGQVGPVTAVLEYRVRSRDGASTRWFRVQPVDPLLLAGLDLELHYPPHVGREPERLAGEFPHSLALPAGTVVRVRGVATRRLTAAVFRHGDGRERSAETSERDFELEWRPEQHEAGSWELWLRDGAGGTAIPMILQLTILPDAAPRVRILLPGTDTVLPLSRRQALVAEAADDHGLTDAHLVYRRVGLGGDRGTAVRVPVGMEGGSDRALIRAILDLSAERLLPGEAVEYHVEVRDNSPSRQLGTSDTYLLRVPSAADLRERARKEGEELLQAAASAASRAHDLERAGRELTRRVEAQGRAAGMGGPGTTADPSPALDSRRAADARRLAESHDAVKRELADLRRRLEQLRDLAGEAGVRDRDLDRRLQELADVYRHASPPDGEGEGDGLRVAAEDLDLASLRAELERLLERQEDMRQALEEGVHLLRAAALDQEMSALAREAEDIAAHQETLAAALREELRDGTSPHAAGSPPAPEGQDPVQADAGAAAGPESDAGPDTEPGADGGPPRNPSVGDSITGEQEELARRASRLNDLIERLQQALLKSGDEQSAGRAGSAQEQGRSAQESMEEAAEQARRQEGEQAAASGQQAAAQMASAAQSLDEARGQRADAAREAAQAAVREAAQDALRLAEREEALRQEMEAAHGASGQSGQGGGAEQQRMQSEQFAVKQGLQQLGRNLSAAHRSSGAVDREVAQALARAMLDLDQALEGLNPGRPMPVQEAGRAVESLNRLAMALLQSEDRSGTSADPALGETLRQLRELAREQATLNAQASALGPLQADSRQRTEGLERLAEQQRGVARQVGDLSGLLGGREDVLGRLDLLSLEANAIAGELEGGRVQAEVKARQERLYHRLLDAGRSLEREDYTEERVGRAADAHDTATSDSLDEALLAARLRYAGPTAGELAALPVAYRRMVLEYFERLNAGAAPAPSSAREGTVP
jgi:hypothetical protein